MDSSETSSNSPLNSDFPHPLPGAESFAEAEHSQACSASGRPRAGQAKHRIAQVRDSQAVSLRTISRRCGVPVRILRQQERPDADLRLSELMVWAEALEVPVRELLTEPEDSLCASIAQRAQMVRLMKTVEAMRAHAKVGSVRRISDAMRQQLLEIMPELEDVTAWPKEGSRRPAGGAGKIATQPTSTDAVESPSQNDSTDGA